MGAMPTSAKGLELRAPLGFQGLGLPNRVPKCDCGAMGVKPFAPPLPRTSRLSMTMAGVRHTELLFSALLSSSIAFVTSPDLW